jgi:hypothetical protein
MNVRVLVVAMVLTVGGCAAAGSTPDVGSVPDAGPLKIEPKWESCAVAAPTQDLAGPSDTAGLPHLDDSFAPVSAVICRSLPVKRPGGGEDMAAVEDRAGDVTALVTALRLPDKERTDNPCTADAVILPFVALIDADGRWVRAGVPIDECAKPRREVRTALEQLTTQRVSTRTLATLESDQAAAAGCGQTWGDMVWATGQMDGGKGSPGAPAADDATVSICVYRVPASEQGSGKPAGQFESGGKFANWAAVKRELAAATPAAPCTTPADRFAVLHTPAGDVYVEADGCTRVLIDNGNALRTGTPKLVALVF